MKLVTEDKNQLRLRTNLVQDRTRVVNRTHSLLDKYDMNFDYSKIFGIKGLQWLRDLRVTGNDQRDIAVGIASGKLLSEKSLKI